MLKMIKLLNLFFFIVCLESCQNIETSKTEGMPNEMECLLVESINSSVKCGTIPVLVAMKFKDQTNNRFFIGLVPCPELYGDLFFKVNEKYLITITNDTVQYRNYSINNIYHESSINLVYINNIERVER